LSRKEISNLPQGYPKGFPQNVGISGAGAAWARPGRDLSAARKSLPGKHNFKLLSRYPMGCPHNVGINQACLANIVKPYAISL
jgi:hypothetical protein